MKISHPSMRRTKDLDEPTTNNNSQTYVVDDPTIEESHEDKVHYPPLPPHLQNPIPQEVISPQEQDKTSGPEPKAEKQESKNLGMLESLLFLGKTTKEVEIEGFKFEISTLTQKENSDLVKCLYATEDGADLFTIRAITLAFAVKKVNNTDLGSIDVDGDFKEDFDRKLYIIENMQKHVTEKLHDEYIDLAEKSNQLINGGGTEDLKN